MSARSSTTWIGTPMILDVLDPRWGGFVAGCADASPFHHPAWTLLLADCYGYRPFALSVVDEGGQIVAGLPIVDVSSPLMGRRWISLPFTDYCPPLTKQRPIHGLVEALVAAAMSQHLDAFEQHADLATHHHLYTRTDAVRHTSTLSGQLHSVYGQFSKMHQRNIRKAERAGLQIKLGPAASDVDTFYRLHLRTRQRLGVPIQPRRFFHLLADYFMNRGLGFVLSAHLDGVPIAAGIFLAWNGVLIYKFGASDPRFWAYRPNNLLIWAAIRWGCENGCHTFDWGRTDLHNHGLREFKAGWGALETPLVYSIIAHAPPRPSSNHLKTALGVVIRRSPPWVCQVIGECLYRFAV